MTTGILARSLAAAIFAAAFAVSGALAADGHWTKTAAGIAATLNEAEALAVGGKPDEAKRKVTEAYFGGFESSKMEAALRREVGGKHAAAREKLFGDLRKLSADPAGFKAMAAELRAGLAADGQALDKAGVSPDVFQVNQ